LFHGGECALAFGSSIIEAVKENANSTVMAIAVALVLEKFKFFFSYNFVSYLPQGERI